jgi:ABC-type lipoprotein export system ATPase subunit
MPVTVRDLGHRFGDRPWLFRGLTTVFASGGVTAITGPSGSGKSTLLSLLAGWTRPTEGTIDQTGAGRVNWVFQNPHGTARRTAVDHVILPFLARGDTIAAAGSAAAELLDRFGLAAVADRPFRELSGGEAQRLMLARGLASRPDVLLIDEPTAQLDRATADTVNSAIGAAATEGIVVVVATHDPATRAACTAAIDLGEHPGIEHA